MAIDDREDAMVWGKVGNRLILFAQLFADDGWDLARIASTTSFFQLDRQHARDTTGVPPTALKEDAGDIVAMTPALVPNIAPTKPETECVLRFERRSSGFSRSRD
jgi:hypothetical protein